MEKDRLLILMYGHTVYVYSWTQRWAASVTAAPAVKSLCLDQIPQIYGFSPHAEN